MVARFVSPVRSRVSPELTCAVTLLKSENVMVPALIAAGVSTTSKSVVSARLPASSSCLYSAMVNVAVEVVFTETALVRMPSSPLSNVSAMLEPESLTA